ncbi:hypothetical protein VTN00DRAFT_9906 [Thermoascus crustaceus]|uniref:uncharacterized protein n=1 Tax=Thermoascus crustaceus TaxID=5088 RepID=UPI003742F791
MTEPTPSSRPSEEKPEGLSKYMRRMKTILRRDSSSKRASVSSISEAGGDKSSKPTAAARPSASMQTTKPTTTTGASSALTAHWSSVQQERARAMFAKYGLTLEPEEWMSPRNLNIERVEKPIRMRVRRTCHNCQTSFGSNKVCYGCSHTRCKKCPRYPPAKTKEQKEAKAKAKAKAAVVAAEELRPKKSKAPVLTIPSRTGGQDLVRKPIKQRVRRTCHRCGTLFHGQATECENCKHVRCKKCPRDPPKLKKYPDGYPGDAEPPLEPQPRVWKKPRRRVRYFCHICSTLYQPGEKVCSKCNQEKGPDTIRQPPKKVKSEPDPEILKRVQEKLAQLDLKT